MWVYCSCEEKWFSQRWKWILCHNNQNPKRRRKIVNLKIFLFIFFLLLKRGVDEGTLVLIELHYQPCAHKTFPSHSLVNANQAIITTCLGVCVCSIKNLVSLFPTPELFSSHSLVIKVWKAHRTPLTALYWRHNLKNLLIGEWGSPSYPRTATNFVSLSKLWGRVLSAIPFICHREAVHAVAHQLGPLNSSIGSAIKYPRFG